MLVAEDSEYYRTQRTVWRQHCWDNKSEFPMHDTCPYCHVKVELYVVDETISASGHAWHSSCYEDYLVEKKKKRQIENQKTNKFVLVVVK